MPHFIFFHSFAVQDRIDFSHLSDTLPLMCSNKPAKVALELLPTDDDDSALEKLFQVHVSRILATHMNYFSFSFEDVVEKHIEHDYHREMSTKSTVVSFIIVSSYPFIQFCIPVGASRCITLQ